MAFSLLAAAWSARENDWTTDEPIHLEWSQRLLDQRLTERASELHFNSKTPVTLLNVAARRFARRSLGVRDPHLARFAARVPGLLWLGVVLLATFRLARRSAGPIAAHLATIAVALDPNLIANSSIATVDTAYAAATLLTVIASLRFLERPGLASGVLLGLALGLAFSVKFTAFLLLPGVLLLPLVGRNGTAKGERAPAGPWLWGLLSAAAVAAGVLCLAYLGVGVGTPFGEISWRSRLFRILGNALPALRLPLPADFLTGLDILLNAERTKRFNVVILGRLYPDGVFYYFGLVWLLKTPVLLLLGVVLGVVRTVRAGLLAGSPGLRLVALHLALGLVYFSFVFRMQIGYRFVLMCVPLVAILAAAGLAGLARRAGFPAGLAFVTLAALAENAPYLGNSLAFTNAAVWPKTQVFRLLADSNVDYGQNHEKMRDLWRGREAAGRHLNPVHVLPGENVLTFNLASGATDFSRHAWLRDHLSPSGHFRHTYLFFEVAPADFERLLAEARRFAPSPRAAEACPKDAPEAVPLDLTVEVRFPAEPRGSVPVVCVWAAATTDLALRQRAGEVLWGRLEAPRREWDRLRGGREAWYRLDPGGHAFVAFEPKDFRGAFTVRGGPATAAVRPMHMRRGRLEPRVGPALPP